MNEDKIKQLENEVSSSLAAIRKLLSDAQASMGALDVFLYQLKKEMTIPVIDKRVDEPA